MKKIIPLAFHFVLYIIAITSYTQPPTKEQTIDFLKSYYEVKGNMSCTEESYPHRTSNSFKLISIKNLRNCEFEIKWEWDYNYYNAKESLKNYSYKRCTMIIDFSKIEEMQYFRMSKRGDCRLYYIKFKGAPGVKFAVTEESDSYGEKKTETYSSNEINIPANNQNDDGGEISEETKKSIKHSNTSANYVVHQTPSNLINPLITKK